MTPIATPNPFEATCLVVATRAGSTLRFERKGVPNTYDTVRRLRALGWSAGVIMPGLWAPLAAKAS